MGYTPPNFLLAQEAHFFAGLALTFAAPALGLPWWSGALFILAVDLAKELTFDRNWPAWAWKWLPHGGERQPFLPPPFENSGLVDWTFYFFGAVVALALLALRFGASYF